MALDEVDEEERGALVESGRAKFDKEQEVVTVEGGKLIGLTKEQLEQYRNDPFWKPLRFILFALFWLAWIAMFAGAILIVLVSPKCAAKQEPDWWQTKVSYQVITPTFYDYSGDGVGDFLGIKDKLDLLRKIGITTIYPSPVIATDKDELYSPYDVVDHLAVDPRFGTEEDFKALVDAAHDRDMYVVMDLPVSCVSPKHPWFQDAAKADMFVWALPSDPGYNSGLFYDSPKHQGKRYLGYAGGVSESKNPVFNWRNEEVKTLIHDAIKKFLLLGVDGFHIDHVSQLGVASDGTTNHSSAIATLKQLTAVVKDIVKSNSDISEKKIVLFSSLRDVEDLHAKAREIGDLHYVVDTSFARLNSTFCPQGVALCVHNALDASYARHHNDDFTPYWQFSNADVPRLASRFDTNTANLLTFMQLTLPGAMSLYYGQELALENVAGPAGQRGVMHWKQKGEDHHGFVNAQNIKDIFYPEEDTDSKDDNFQAQYSAPNSPLKVYQKLAKLRQRDEALILGATVRHELINDMIIFSRFVRAENNTATGSAFVVALNFGELSREIDLTTLQGTEILPANKQLTSAEVVATTSGLKELTLRQKLDLTSQKVALPAKQGVLFRL